MGSIRALRGATTCEVDEPAHITQRVVALLERVLEQNDVDKEDLVSILFTSTDDLHSMFPAAAARTMGLGDVPLICARELDIEGGTARCIRVLLHLSTSKPRSALHHVYMEGAQGLRDDLPE